MFDIIIGISQQELTHDKGHTPRGSSVTLHVSRSLSFPSQRQRFLAHQTDVFGVLTVVEKSGFTRGTDSRHAQIDAGRLFVTRDKYLLKSWGPSRTPKSFFQEVKNYQPGNI